MEGNNLTMCRDVGKGFFFPTGNVKTIIHKDFMLFPCKPKRDICMLQSCVPSFNPDYPSNLEFCIWVTLKDLPFEHHDLTCQSAKSLREIIGSDKPKTSTKYQEFYSNLKSRGWISHIASNFEEDITIPSNI